MKKDLKSKIGSFHQIIDKIQRAIAELKFHSNKIILFHKKEILQLKNKKIYLKSKSELLDQIMEEDSRNILVKM